MTSGTVARWKALYFKYNPMNANKPASIADIAFDTGVIAERERIIKLLEEARDKCACYREVGMPVCRHQLSVDEQIALIKGEING